METIGFLELNSIAKGIEAADIVLKTAAVELIFSRAGCPGKYYLLFTGDVAAVQASIEAGCAAGGDHVVDHCVIPSVHPQVIRAINMTNMPEELRAVGVMEFFSVTASVYSADAACMNGIESVRTNAPIAALEDQTVENYEKQKHPKFEMYLDKAGEYRFRLKARNGEVIAVSEGYKAKASCENGIASVRTNAPDAQVVKAEG